MANPFTIDRAPEPVSGARVLTLDGFLDAHTAPEFDTALQAEIDAGATRLIVDCQKLTYISSAGLGVFMGFVDDVAAFRGRAAVNDDLTLVVVKAVELAP